MTCFAVRRLATVPDLTAIHQADPGLWPYLLASEVNSGRIGRWSLLFHQRGEILQAGPGRESAQAFLQSLGSLLDTDQELPADLPKLPFFGGWFLYLGYELTAGIETRLCLPEAQDGLPVALAARCPGAIVVDHHRQQAWVAGESEPLVGELAAAVEAAPASLSRPALPSLKIEADRGEGFMRGVNRIKEWIAAGDVFQVNLSRGWRATGPDALSAIEVYRALAQANPAPFAGLARLPGGTVVSSSPERLVAMDAEQIHTRPIAGTRPRGACRELDLGLSSELIASPKERAEHIMLIDLERNDLGRVCVTGSVEVDELMVIESYAHVHHIVSNVRGLVRPGVTPVDVIAAVFPGGTITGCPKVRCMEIIAQLEGRGRGFYTGSMGYLGRHGVMDLNILIRSMVVSGNQIGFRTGAGIVADSDPDAELAETEAKARGLLKALGAT